MKNIFLAKGLSDRELRDIRELESVCGQYEPLNMKLNWEMLENRPAGEMNDFLYYDNEKLIGFLGLYDIERKSREIEITGMVSPEFRRRGVFKELFNLAKQECYNRKAKRILLISERLSNGGKGFAKFTGFGYSFSEYKMKFEGTTIPDFPSSGITLRKAEFRDYFELNQMDKWGFGFNEEESANLSDNIFNSTFLGEMAGSCIGKIGILMEGKDGYIFGFTIKPEYRRRGYGREVLRLAMLKLLDKQINSILLEVAVENESALQLYKSCGFHEITVYDYYENILR